MNHPRHSSVMCYSQSSGLPNLCKRPLKRLRDVDDAAHRRGRTSGGRHCGLWQYRNAVLRWRHGVCTQPEQSMIAFRQAHSSIPDRWHSQLHLQRFHRLLHRPLCQHSFLHLQQLFRFQQSLFSNKFCKSQSRSNRQIACQQPLTWMLHRCSQRQLSHCSRRQGRGSYSRKPLMRQLHQHGWVKRRHCISSSLLCKRSSAKTSAWLRKIHASLSKQRIATAPRRGTCSEWKWSRRGCRQSAYVCLQSLRDSDKKLLQGASWKVVFRQSRHNVQPKKHRCVNS
mmetsp:Transcript_40773/g.73658  ORF Transcript_40773/g.73658 Transcript_40773/m.73658 type:complete len:282 (-) Transcript_40773:498-1343(-)